MKKNKQILAALASYTDPPPDDVLLPFSYNLLPDGITPVDGCACLCSDALYLYCDGRRTNRIPRDRIKAFAFRLGNGCVLIEYQDSDENEFVLCRSGMEFKDYYAALTKQLNRALRGESFCDDYEKETERSCPKCNRPYTPGSRTCPFCTGKGSYLKRIWALARPYAKTIYLAVAIYFLISAINLITPYLNGILVDRFIQAKTTPLLWQYLLVLLSILLINVIVRPLSMLRSGLLINAGSRVVVRLRELVFRKVELMSVSHISKRTAGELMNSITEDTAVLQNFITNEMSEALEKILTFFAIAIVLVAYDWKLAAFILLPIPIVFIANRIFFMSLHKLYHRQWFLNAQSSAVLHDIFSGIRVVKAFGMEKREIKRFDDAIYEHYKISVRNEKFFGKFSPILQFFLGSGEFFLLYYVGAKILGNEMTLGQMMQFSSYVALIYGPIEWLSRLPRQLARVMTSVVKVYDIIDEEADVTNKPDAKTMDIRGEIKIDHVSFGYDNTMDILKDVTLEIKPGEMIGIVGKSGVGKSTLINLIMRLYDVSDGAIKIDGVDIRDIAQESLRAQIGVVLQENFLFSGSILDNIAYAKPDATFEEVVEAAKISGAHSFIMKLPDAYQTRVGERGHTLSGGERQRISIARALLRNPRILILDEATASLDTETEKQIQDALQKLIADRTTIAIAHRLSTLRNATKLVVLDRGTVAEIGTHEELIAKKGIYYGLVMAQRQMSKMMPKQDASA